MTLSDYYNRWIKPYVPNKGDNLLECEGQLRQLIDNLQKDAYDSGHYDGVTGIRNVYQNNK